MPTESDVLVTLSAFILSLLISTIIIDLGIVKPLMRRKSEIFARTGEINPGNEKRSLGFWIGFFETIVIFSFVYAGEYEALALLIGAKEYVRKEKIRENASYYLLGTLINLAVAVCLAELSHYTICHITS